MAAIVREGQRVRRRRDAATAYTLLIPSFIGTGLFLVVPVIAVGVLAFFKWDLISPAQFVGFENFAWLGGNAKFWNSILVTGKFVLMAIPASVILGLLLAVALNRGLPGTRTLRVIYVLPWVCAPLALGVVWQWMFAPSNGVINAILGVRIEWLSDMALALPAIAVSTRPRKAMRGSFLATKVVALRCVSASLFFVTACLQSWQWAVS